MMILETLAIIGLFGAGAAYGAKHKENTKKQITTDAVNITTACASKVCEVTSAVKAKMAAKKCKPCKTE